MTARPRGWLGFGFGPRFLAAFAAGLLWLVPAWRDTRFVAAMFAWDGAMLALWLIDLWRLPAAAKLDVQREWAEVLSLGRACPVTVEIRNESAVALQLTVLDDAPPVMRGIVAGGGSARLPYRYMPRTRGDIHIGNLYVRYRSLWGFAERWAMVPIAETVTVLPDLGQAREQAVLLIRSRQIELGQRARMQRGLGREFESLRDYRYGDEYRDVCWSATARRNALVTRTYEAERSQSIWVLLDCGRLSGARIQTAEPGFTLSKLDHGVNAALSLAEVALYSGDRVGMIGYGRAVQRAVACHRGGQHIGGLAQSLAHVRTEPREANHWLAARTLMLKQQRRALVLWITDFAETAATPEVVECAMHLTRKHLVIMAAVSQPDLVQFAKKVPATEGEMFRHAAAQEIAQRREALLRTLRRSGVLALELTPDRLAVSIVNEYLTVKERNRL
jgi:uncharacterized protein (DUF58 family)